MRGEPGAMSADILRALSAPESVALIGASDTPGRLTARPMTFLQQNGFQGRIYPVNPARETVMGQRAYPSVTAIPEPVDMAYILLNTEPAIAALEGCAAAGVKVVAMLADGFAEAGEEGLARQRRVAEIARDAGILLIGPNSMGVVNTANGLVCTTNAAFGTATLPKGRLAVLSQSGSVIGTLVSRGAERGIGYSLLVSLGNEAATGIGTLGGLLLDHEGTDGYLLFMETIRDPEALADFARGAAARGKPVVAYIIGQSEEGQALSVSHTGALTGSAEAVSAFLAGIGIRQVQTFETLIEAPAAIARLGARGAGRPRQVTVMSTTGGGGAMVLDQISARGATIAGTSDAARATLAAAGIPAGHGKLVDVTLAGAKYETMKKTVSTLIADPATGLLVVAIGSSAQFNPELAVRPIVDAVAEAAPGAAPVVAFPLPHAPESMKLLEAGGVPTFRTVETCAETVAMLMAPPPEVAPVTPELPAAATAAIAAAVPGVLDEVEAGAICAALGIAGPRQVLLDPGADRPGDPGLGWPVVAKLVSPDLPHKTDAGAIRIGIGGPDELAAAIAGMRASAEAYHPGYRLKGILVQEMCRGLGEVLVGLTRDPLVGPVLTVAAGGVMTEIYRDSAVRPAPVSRETAREMLAEVKGLALLRGFRGRPEGDLEALAGVVAAVSGLACDPRIEEVEINPVLVREKGAGVVMLDALIRRG